MSSTSTTTTTTTPITSTYRDVYFSAKYSELEEYLEAIANAPKIQDWVDKFLEKDQLTITGPIKVGYVKFFGPPLPERLGFLVCEIPCVNKADGFVIQANVVTIRGGAICVYIIITIEETGERFVLFVKQIRVAGFGDIIELVAGMLDHRTKKNQIMGPVMDEIREETGLDPKVDELVQLGPAFRTSIGLLDEEISPYLWEKTITKQAFEEMKTKIYGVDENEKIKIKFCPFEKIDEFLDLIGDCKADSAHRRVLAYMRMQSRDLGR